MIKKTVCAFVLVLHCVCVSWAGNGFITTWKVTADDLTITIPTDQYGQTYAYSVNWGDDTISSEVKGDANHTYAKAGTYIVEINGTFPAIYFGDLGIKNMKEAAKLYTIEQWGNIQWKDFNSAFFNCKNLVCNATDAPDLSQVTNMAFMFYGADNFNGKINHWDVSTITNMSQMFIGADNFNSEIGNWDVSNVTNMSMMFYKASSFNQPIGNWNTGKVTDMSQMFSCAYSFNQSIENWDVSNVTDMSQMFASEISIETHKFNQPLGNWDVSNVTNMEAMFARATDFNQPIGDWNVANVTNMDQLFSEAVAFNQSLGNWDIAKVKSMINMFEYAGLDTKNYDATLIGWASQHVQKNVNVGAYKMNYCKAKNARQKLIDSYNWNIREDILSCK